MKIKQNSKPIERRLAETDGSSRGQRLSSAARPAEARGCRPKRKRFSSKPKWRGAAGCFAFCRGTNESHPGTGPSRRPVHRSRTGTPEAALSQSTCWIGESTRRDGRQTWKTHSRLSALYTSHTNSYGNNRLPQYLE